MPSYKIEILIRHPDEDREDELEQELQGLLYGLGAIGITGITAYQVWPHD